jgi:hypothetical protein
MVQYLMVTGGEESDMGLEPTVFQLHLVNIKNNTREDGRMT